VDGQGLVGSEQSVQLVANLPNRASKV
jgi:hypothetical protein